MRVRLCWLGLLMFGLPATLGAGGEVAVNVSAKVAMSPTTLRVRATIEPHVANRALVLVADSGHCYRSSEIQLDGESAPRASVFEYRGLPSGEYVLSATLLGAGRTTRAVVHQVVSVR